MPDRVQARVVVCDLKIGDTGDLVVHLRAAHLLLGDVFTDCSLDQMRASQRHRRHALHHRHEVGQAGDVRGSRSAGAHHRGDLRHHAGHDDLLAEQLAGAREHRAGRFLDARAGGVDEPDDRHALAQGELAHARGFELADHAHRAGHHREVVRDQTHAPAVDAADAGDAAVGGRELSLHLRVLGLLMAKQPGL